MRKSTAHITITLFAALLTTAGNSFAVDTQLLNLVMPDAQIMAGINITNSEITPLGTFLLAQISANDQSLQELIAQTGFDPRKDVTEVLAASNGNQAAPASLALSKGNFDVAKIVAAIGAKSNQTVSTYNGATLITVGADGSSAVAFLGNTIAIAGNLASVKAAVDRSSLVNSVSPALATQAQALSTSQDAWSVSLASLGALIPGSGAASSNGMAGQALQLVKNIQSCSAGLKFGPSVQFTAQAVADTPEDAGALGDVIKMVASLAAMGAGSNKDAAAIAQMLQSLQVTTTGSTVNLSATVPESQIEALLSAALTPKAAAAAKVRKM
jgi:hypothetical protein